MKNQPEDQFNWLGRVLFMALFLLMLAVHSDQSDKPTYFGAQYELLSEIHSDSDHAILVDFIQPPSFQKTLVSFADKTGLLLFNQTFKITVDNHHITQRIILIQKSLLSLRPTSTCRFYYHLFPINADEPPLLS